MGYFLTVHVAEGISVGLVFANLDRRQAYISEECFRKSI